jgi:hypothetical protein
VNAARPAEVCPEIFHLEDDKLLEGLLRYEHARHRAGNASWAGRNLLGRLQRSSVEASSADPSGSSDSGGYAQRTMRFIGPTHRAE